MDVQQWGWVAGTGKPGQQICTVIPNSLLQTGWTLQPRASLLRFSTDGT